MFRIPETRVLFGQLDRQKSQFGDEFLNSPKFLGKRPPPGRTFLNGWIAVRFDEPKESTCRFVIDFEAVGTDETLRWGGGQNFKMIRNRMSPLLMMPGGGSTVSEGVLNLETGEIVPRSLMLKATFQNSLIGQVGALNRLPFAFPFIYPSPEWPDSAIATIQDSPEQTGGEYGELAFSYYSSREISGIRFRAETNVPVSDFPSLDLFPAFCFGNEKLFYFGFPTHAEPDTPATIKPSEASQPDGIALPSPAYFHPHLYLEAQLSEGDIEVPASGGLFPLSHGDVVLTSNEDTVFALHCSDEGEQIGKLFQAGIDGKQWQELPGIEPSSHKPTLVATANYLFLIGGYEPDGMPSNIFQVYDLESGVCKKAQTMDFTVADPAVAVIDDQLIIAGGWTNANDEMTVADSVYKLDLANEKWSSASPMLVPVANATAVCRNNEMWVCNGKTRAGHATRRVSVYNPGADRWGFAASTPFECYGASAIVAGGCLNVIGGFDGQGRERLDFWQLDFESDQWVQAIDCPSSIGHCEILPAANSCLSVLHSDGLNGLGKFLFSPQHGWQAEKAVFFSGESLFVGNAGLASHPCLCPSTRTTLLHNSAPGQKVEKLLIGSEVADILTSVDGKIEFVCPTDIDNGSDRKDQILTLVAGDDRHSVRFNTSPHAPSIFVLNFSSIQVDPWVYREWTYMHRASGLVENEDASLNYPSQPALPGERITIYATGLAEESNPHILLNGSDVGEKLKVDHNSMWSGVSRISFAIPDDQVRREGILQSCKIGIEGIWSNEVTISVSDTSTSATRDIAFLIGAATVFGGGR